MHEPDSTNTAISLIAAKREQWPLAVEAFQSLLELQPAYYGVAEAASRRDDVFWSDAEARCREILYLCEGSREDFRLAVGEWIAFSYEFLIKQRKFLKSGHYAATDFETIRRNLYENDEKMSNFYLIALMFSFLFSSNYVGFYGFFRRNFLSRAREARSVADVGCGHGVYLAQMLLAGAEARGVGVDISRGSLTTTSRLLAFHNIGPARHDLVLGDVQSGLDLANGSQDLVTCFEVIEHLERPDIAAGELRRILKPTSGRLCVSTAIRMESVDHVHLFKTPEEVDALFSAAQLVILQREIIPLTTEDLEAPGVRTRLVSDPQCPLGYIAIAQAAP